MSYLDELNEIQRAAVTHKEGPVMIVAGPGSGKTRVLTYRIAHLINSGVKPWEILSLTFTNKAAKEMKARIAKVVGDKANQVWAGTFHSIFARLLRNEADKIGYNSNFTIYDSADSQSLVTQLIKEQGLDPKAYSAAAVYSRISLAKNNLVTPEMYKRDSERLMSDKQQKRPEIYKIYSLYVNACQRNSAMDFDDLLFKMHDLLKQFPEVAAKYQSRFKYILVDEFQDTNSLQYSIVQQLINYDNSTHNITVVGDDAQSIYAFRGATIENILNFQRDYPKLAVYKLEQNYRSTPYIVAAANDVISKNRKQIKKTIFTDKPEGEQIRVVKTMTDEEEGRRVADLIMEQKHRYHFRNQDFAILYRTNGQSRIFEECLTHQRITYKVYGGMSFYQRKEVKDYIAYLRLALNPSDTEALKRVINYPRRGIGDTTIDKLIAISSSQNMSLWDVLKQIHNQGMAKNTTLQIEEFVKLILDFQKRLSVENAYDFAMMVGRRSGILAELKADTSPEGMARLDNANSLLDGIKAFMDAEDKKPDEDPNLPTDLLPISETADKSLANFLQNIALLTDADNDEGNEDRVKLMSVHAAKGLEFKSVFVVGLEENSFPSFMALQSEDKWSAIDEERRLFYVAITRAEQFLTLSYSASRYKFGKMSYNDVSRFISEIDEVNLDTPVGRTRSGVSGLPPREMKNFGRVATVTTNIQGKSTPIPNTNNPNFVASPASAIKVGLRVRHQNFGDGLVTNMDGAEANRVITILFDHASAGEKRIMLRFAKLQIL